MRVGVQWTLATPADWQWADLRPGQAARAWERLPKKPKQPVGALPTLDGLPGWVMALNVQGVIFEGYDGYSVSLHADGVSLLISVWTEDYPGDNYAMVWTFRPLRADNRIGGRLNTDQSSVVYSERPEVWTGNGWTGVQPYSRFVRPAESLTKYGVWVSDAVWAAHQAARSLASWADWA